MSSEYVCKPRWSGNGEAHPAANLMLSVPGAIDAILDIGERGTNLKRAKKIKNQTSSLLRMLVSGS